LIIVGSAGQYRYTIIKEVTGILKKNNRNFHIVRTTYLTHDILRNIDGSDIEAIIITSCPRLAIEDFTKYDKPVLTPGEVMYMFGLREDYTYPW
ncbi:MAG TPA: diphthamide biosynthesis enzyme Dph2, partial [Acidilobales archaeon]|nr:diphthamide biosynthesis enzyme Dph2 [Acidilobales archaeon]